MKYQIGFISALLLLAALAPCALAQDRTEVYGFFEAYRNFDYKTGGPLYPAIREAEMNGGGGGIAYQYAPWFALWTQLSFYGTTETEELGARIINNLQGVRYQTPQYGPFVFYGKGGLGFSNYNITEKLYGNTFGATKFSAGYAGGLQIWLTDNFGLMLELSHLLMGVPNLTDEQGRDRWDSGLSAKTGLAVRF